MGQGGSSTTKGDDGEVESFCFCAERKLPTKKQKKKCRMTFEEAFSRKNILYQLDNEIDDMFKEFDLDESGVLDSGPELQNCIKVLMERGYAFGKKIEKTTLVSSVTTKIEQTPLSSSRYTHDSRSTAASDTDTGSKYQTVTYRRVCNALINQVLAETIEEDINDSTKTGQPSVSKEDVVDRGIDNHGFRIWFRREVVQKKKNLRCLLSRSGWLIERLEVAFDKADADQNGTVGRHEMIEFVQAVSEVIGEPAPEDRELRRIFKRADKDLSDELDLEEFFFVIIEVLTKLYYTHFNESMNCPNARHAFLSRSPLAMGSPD